MSLCPLCKQPASAADLHPSGAAHIYECPRCGKFEADSHAVGAFRDYTSPDWEQHRYLLSGRARLALICIVAVTGCGGGSSQGRDGASGGTTGVAGQGGTTGSGGGAGSTCTGPDQEGFPCCLTDLWAPCLPSGSCVADNVGHVCYENGVTYETDSSSGRTTVRTSGGTICYTYTESFELDAGTNVVTYFDARGSTVGMIWVVTLTSGRVACVGESPTPYTRPPPSGTCTPGTCN